MFIRPITVSAALASLATLSLTGCSAEQVASSGNATSRMTRPSEVPQVGDDIGQTGTGVPVTQETGTSQYVQVPEQIWVRSASRGGDTYSLTIATASGGTFSVYDAHAVGGPDAPGNSSQSCAVVSHTPLPNPIKGAIKAVNTLVTLRCPAKNALTMPVVRGEWGNETKGGQSEAIFALGGSQVQGSPATNDSIQVDAGENLVDATVVSVTHQGSTLHVRAWATDYAGMNVEKADPSGDTYDDPQCTTTLLAQHRPGIKTRTEQRLFDVSCANLPKVAGYTLTVMTLVGKVGEAPTYLGQSVDLKVGASTS